MGERGLRLVTREATLARCAALVSAAFDEVEDIIPADGSILVVLKPGATLTPGLAEALTAPLPEARAATGSRHTIMVEFGGRAGPDLAECACRSGLLAADYIGKIVATEYTVAFLGFQPGFPYLSGLPPSLAAPRRASPRLRVAAGSVAIGGAMLGIYPAEGPGGWNLLGRTRMPLFDPTLDPPALLRPGDRVCLVPA